MSKDNINVPQDKALGIYAPDEKDWFANVVFSYVFSLWTSSGIGIGRATEQLENVTSRMKNLRAMLEVPSNEV